MQISDLGEWVRGLDEPAVAPAAYRAAAPPRLVRGDRAGLPLARPAVGHALGRRGAAHQDDPPPRLLTHRRHLRLRRAHHRPPPARHRADERAAARSCATRATRCSSWSTSRRRSRSPTTSWTSAPAPVRRAARSASRAPSRGCGPAARSPAAISTTEPRSRRRCGPPPAHGDPRRGDQQPSGRRRRHPARRAGRGHRRRRFREELADPRLDPAVGGRGLRSTRAAIRGSRRSNPATYTEAARPDPQGVREGQRRQARAVQRQLRGRLPHVQRRRRDLHRPRDDGRRGHHLRGLRGEAVPGVGAGVPAGRPRHQRGARDAGRPRPSSSSATAMRTRRPPTRSSTGSSTSGSDTSSLGQPLTTLSGGERQRLKLATHMGEKGAPTSSTSRPPACTSPTSSSCSACSTGWWTQASR